ncbi:putative phage tail protein [Paenibacillus alvei]|uniref:putative phage tail protein n=1 Tax=Paenibacillus alvei TaxID=44250 RepID=UPI00228266F1|nr:putative phage tail protein [Paenibacillus alvei]MCY7486052.1 YmfQ family protein [Paenibacillus alvei]
MLPRLPTYYDNSRIMHELLNAETVVIEELKGRYTEFKAQPIIDTVTYTIDRWERIFGITPDPQKPIEHRREQVKAKARGAGTVTKAHIKNVIEAYTNGEVEIIEHPAEYRFEIKFVNKYGRPPRIEDVKAIIEQIKPAHLAYGFIFKYATHGDLRGKTHAELSKFTHVQIREGAGLNG